jgi:competence protein ComEC
MLRRSSVLALVAMTLFACAVVAADKTKTDKTKTRSLEIYWVDVEGGGATLIVTPAGESVLVDAGFPGGRDAGRIAKVAKEVAGLDRIDALVVTHYHIDHFGGVAELAALLPIGTVYEHGIDSAPEAERAEPALLAYRSAKVGRRIVVRPGDEVLLAQVQGMALLRLQFLGARQKFVAAESDAANEACAGAMEKEADTSDNANSVVLRLDLGHFHFFDGGDLTWNAEGRLVCPADRVGPVDVYQSDHHGLDQSNNPALLNTLKPTVVVFNNGPRKGGEKGSIAAATALPSVQGVYQVHRNVREGAINTAPERIANLEEDCGGNYVKLTVDPSGKSYTVSVPSTHHQRTYKTKAR